MALQNVLRDVLDKMGEMRPLSNLKTPDDRQCPLNVIRVGPIVHTKRHWRSAGSQSPRADQESLLRM